MSVVRYGSGFAVVFAPKKVGLVVVVGSVIHHIVGNEEYRTTGIDGGGSYEELQSNTRYTSRIQGQSCNLAYEIRT